jgi:hypothetical protein
MTTYKAYRVWFSNGTAVSVDARSENEARQKALEIARKNGYHRLRVSKVDK